MALLRDCFLKSHPFWKKLQDSKTIKFLDISITQNLNEFPLILSGDSNSLISQPILLNPLPVSIFSAFSFLDCLSSQEMNYNHTILKDLVEKYTRTNLFFFNQLLLKDLYLFGKILSRKYISRLNIIQKLFVKIRLKSINEEQYERFPIMDIINFLNNSYI